jgi:hypothetical protein
VGAKKFKILTKDDPRYQTNESGIKSQIDGIKPGEYVMIIRPGSREWVQAIGMDRYNWSTDLTTFFFERKVVSCENGVLEFDIPLPQSLDQQYKGALVLKAPENIRIRECGIESIRFDCKYDEAITGTDVLGEKFPSDEKHAGRPVGFLSIEDGWMSDCTSLHMTHGLVGLNVRSRRITVQDCKSLDPVSLITGMRRYAYEIGGTANLFQRCYSRKGRHDFITQGAVAGPNAVVDCIVESAYDATENHQKWAMGTLFDNVRVSGPGSGLIAANRGRWGYSHGWSGNTTVFWNCASPVIFALQPPLGQNFMIGCSDPKLFDPGHALSRIKNQNNASGRKDELVVGDALQGTAWKESPNESITPRSLYYAQLQARLGKAAVENVTTNEQRQRR